VSILPAFNKQLFANVFCRAFLWFLFGFLIFWQNEIGEKAAGKLFVKLTTGVNFINILQSAFFCTKRVLRFFYVISVWVCNFLVKCLWNWPQMAWELDLVRPRHLVQLDRLHRRLRRLLPDLRTNPEIEICQK